MFFNMELKNQVYDVIWLNNIDIVIIKIRVIV